MCINNSRTAEWSLNSGTFQTATAPNIKITRLTLIYMCFCFSTQIW
jgi:hypothetical protein